LGSPWARRLRSWLCSRLFFVTTLYLAMAAGGSGPPRKREGERGSRPNPSAPAFNPSLPPGDSCRYGWPLGPNDFLHRFGPEWLFA
jgi:hypothetical protein